MAGAIGSGCWRLLRDLAPGVRRGRGRRRAATPAHERNLWARVEPLAGAEPPREPVPARRLRPARPAWSRVEHGLPVALNGVAMAPAELVDSLDDDRPGARRRHLHGDAATPTARRWRVHAAGGAGAASRLRAPWPIATCDAATMSFAAAAAEAYAGLVRDGHWFTPLRGGLDAFVDRVLDTASGEVTMTMQHGRIEVGA